MTSLGVLDERARTRMPRHVTPLVVRPRLEDLLADGVRRQITLISAPPGAGKTTLMASWASSRPTADVCWLTLDVRHNEPGRFEQALWAALAEDGSAVLALDDAQELTAPDALQMLAELVHDTPQGLDVVIATRADPPVRMGRARLEGRLGNIRNADLVFSLAEAGELLSAHGLDVRREDRLALWRRTEGWAAGLALVAIALEDGADAHRFAQDETAAEAAVSDYLLNEVLALLDAETRRFLLRTSIVERINPDLACLLSDDADGGRRLAELERRGLFLMGMDGGEWFHYHSLLAALLRARLRREEPRLARELHRAAAGWFASHGMMRDAEEHARTAEDWELLGLLVGGRWLEAVRSGDATIAPLEPLTHEQVCQARALTAVAAGRASAKGDLAGAASFLATLDHPVGVAPAVDATADDGADTATAVLVAQLLFGCAFGTSEPSVTAAQALSGPDVDVRLRSFALLRRVELLLDRGDLHGAEAVLEELGRTSPARWSTSEAEALLALVLAVQGQASGSLRLAAGVRDQLGEARTATTYVLELAEHVANAESGQYTPRSTLDHPTADGAFAGSHALTTCLRVVRAVRGEQTWLDAGTAHHPLASRVLVALGAVEVVDGAGTTVPVGGPAELAVRRAREALAAHALKAASAAVEPWTGRAASEVHPRTRVELAVLAAVISHLLDAEDVAMHHLDAAFDATEESGAVAPLVENAGRLEPLLVSCATAPGPRQVTALRLLEGLRHVRLPAFVEPLTDRESVVLRFLPTLMSNVEIADAMHVSVNTVKTHLKALYRKLGVDRRRQAVLRAGQLELL